MQTQTAPSTIGEALSDLRYDRDREYDQTAKTEPDGVCPVCRSAECPRPSNTTEPPAVIGAHAERRVSPAILEFRNQELTGENIDLKERLRVATERIAGYERYYASFAQKIDEFETAFKVMTGESVAVFIGNRAPDTLCDAGICNIHDCAKPVATPNEYEIGRCVFPAGHAGPCSIGV